MLQGSEVSRKGSPSGSENPLAMLRLLRRAQMSPREIIVNILQTSLCLNLGLQTNSPNKSCSTVCRAAPTHHQKTLPTALRTPHGTEEPSSLIEENYSLLVPRNNTPLQRTRRIASTPRDTKLPVCSFSPLDLLRRKH